MIIKDLKSLYAILPDPGPDFRSLPFWGWNDRLEENELRTQLRDMHDKGIGGCFSHARDGIETPYLSDEWMNATRVMVDECKRSGMRAWIYDEDKWPSGSAGGQVAARDPEHFTAKGLTLEVLSASVEPTCAPDEAIIGIYDVSLDGKRIVDPLHGQTRIVLRKERSRPGEWYNNSAPSDNLNADAVRAFIDLTHERYKKELGGDLSDHIEGFFTDEPNVFDFFAFFTPGRPWLPWTDDFPAAFQTLRGYSILEQLPLLFFSGEGSTRIRHDYWRTVTELFSDRFMKQIYDWCDENRVRFTGHILYENDLGYNIRVCGAAMPQYRYLHAPGIDILGEQCREYLTLKQCTSVAHQYGRDMAISETYGCTGWEFDFAGQKWLGDWQFVMGIDHRCMHMSQYSIAGCRKRDYPPVFNYQTTWWPYARRIEDYFARLSACVNTGEVVRDLLVIHPISSLWTMCASDPDEDLNNIEMNQGWKDTQFTDLNRLGNEYNRLAEILTRSHFDFDFGDEIILSERGIVDADRIKVGCGSYRTVIVPKLVSMFASTLELLRAFVENGGTLIWLGDAPSMIEGVPSDAAADLFRYSSVIHLREYDELPAQLRLIQPNTLRVSARDGGDAKDILTMLRRVDNDMLLFAVNHSRSEKNSFRVRLPINGCVTAYDAYTDTRRNIPCVSDGAETVFLDTLEPNASCVYFIENDAVKHSDLLVYPYEHPHRADNVFAVLGPSAPVRRTAPNALPLDMCSYSLNGSAASPIMEVWQAQRRIRETLGMQQVYYNGIPQRYTWLDRADAYPDAPFALRFEFYVDDVPIGPVFACVEKPYHLSLTYNGDACPLTDNWYVDRAMRLFELPQLRPGRNELVLSGSYTLDLELEDIFILGDFEVTPQRTIAKETGRLHFGDWCFQGYLHYNGAMVYSFDVPYAVPADKRVILRLSRYEGVLAEISVNGRSVACLFGECYRETDITDHLLPDNNRIEITVVATPRNLFGPFHQAYDGCSRISWADFRTEGALFCEDYAVHPYGLMDRITLILQ